ncbi:CorA-like protein [Enterococcus faecalis 13-SD-W-01]|nr:CorA-like protein [Enterococcus faecalis 13-SD-W-01]
MFSYYFVDEKGVVETDESNYNWLIADGSDDEAVGELIQKFHLPDDTFTGSTYPEEVSRIESLTETTLKDPLLIALIDLEKTEGQIEDRLKPVVHIISEGLMITCRDSKHSKANFIENLREEYGVRLISFEKILMYSILTIYNHFVDELKTMKKQIDQLDGAARKTTENEELFRQATLERNIVYIDHTLRDQKSTMEELWGDENFTTRLGEGNLLYDVHLRQRQAQKMIVIYRDLLESIGDLFNGMMDNNLNHLMKYLDSAALIISIPALIAGLWGMNTGGMPGENSTLGFFLVIIGAVILTALVGWHLSRKDYSK